MFNQPHSSNNFAIVLAAGFSTRMGVCKTTLPWLNQQSLLTYQVTQFLEAGFTPIVVLGAHNAHRQRDCPTGCQVVINPNPERGKTSSLLLGLQALPSNFAGVAIAAVDQPRPAALYRTLLDWHQAHPAPITAPTYAAKLGHPLLFANEMLPALLAIREETCGLRQVVQTFYDQIQQVEGTTPLILSDLNTPETYHTQFGSLKTANIPVSYALFPRHA